MTGNIHAILGGPFSVKHFDTVPLAPKKQYQDPTIEFTATLKSFGFKVQHITRDKFVGCGIEGTRRANSKPGWYIFNIDDRTGAGFATFGDWRDDSQNTWVSESAQKLSPPDREELQRRLKEAAEKAKKEKQQAQDKAAINAQQYCQTLSSATTHPYLDKKQLNAKGVLSDTQKNELIIPLKNSQGEIRNYQRITKDGGKWFLKEAEKLGCYFQIGKRFTLPTYIVEGWATGQAIHEATSKCVVVAFDTSNLLPVGRAIQSKASQIIYAADNDYQTPNNPGIKKATEAAEAIGAQVIWPDDDIDDADFAGLYLAKGEQAVAKKLGCIKPERPYQLIDALNAPPIEPVNYIVEDFIVAGTYSILWGVDGTGKSLLVQDMALSVATGKSWAGKEVQRGAVLYIAGEGHPDLQNRISAWRKHHDKEHESFGFYYTSTGVDMTSGQMLDLIQDDLDTIESACNEPVKLLIVDTLSTNFGDGSEKDDKDARAFVKPLIRLANATKIAVIVVHHANKTGDGGASGSRLFQGDAYTKLEVTRPEKQKIKLKTHKVKSGVEPDPMEFKFHQVDLGHHVDHKGRTLPLVAPVCVFEGASAFGKETASNLIANSLKDENEAVHMARWSRLKDQEIFKDFGETQKIVFNVIADIASDQQKNQPGREHYLVLKIDVFEKLEAKNMNHQTRSRALKRLAEKQIIAPVGSGKHEQFKLISDFI